MRMDLMVRVVDCNRTSNHFIYSLVHFLRRTKVQTFIGLLLIIIYTSTGYELFYNLIGSLLVGY